MKQARVFARIGLVLGAVAFLAVVSPGATDAQIAKVAFSLRARPSLTSAILNTFRAESAVVVTNGTCSERLQREFDCAVPGCTDVKNDNGGFINYLYVQDCIFEGVSVVGWLLLLLWLIFLLYLLGDTADGFFCPALDVIVDVLRLSPNVAGVTFLSFGNGAPDVFASLAAFLSGAGQVGVSAILGAGVLVTSLVVGAVAFASPPNSRLDARPFLRDVGFYIVATGYLFLCFQDNRVHVGEALGFNAIYAVFALAVIFARRCEPAAKSPGDDLAAPLMGESDDIFREDALVRESFPDDDDDEHSINLDESASQAAGLRRAAATGAAADIAAADADAVPRPGAGVRGVGATRAERSSSDLRGPAPRQPKAAKLGEIGRQRSMSTPWGRDIPHRPVGHQDGPLHRRGHTRWFERHTRHTHRLLAHLQRGEAASRADLVSAAVARSRKESGVSFLRGDGRHADTAASYALGGRGRGGSSFSHLFWGAPAPKESVNSQPPEVTPANTARRTQTRVSTGSSDSDEKAAVSVRPSDVDFLVQGAGRPRSASNASSYRRPAAASLYGVPDGVSGEVSEVADRMAEEDWAREEAAVAAASSCTGPVWDALSTLLTWLLLPSTLVRKVSVPVLTEEDYEPLFCAATPAFGLPLITLIVLTTAGYDASAMVAPLVGSSAVLCPLSVATSVGAAAAALLFWRLPRHAPPEGALLILLTFMAFLTAVSWIITIANEIVALLESLGLLLGVSTTVLGLTVLAWGNSLGDLVADVAVAKGGEPRMAIAATYAGPLFNLLVGLGLSLTVGALKSDTGYIELQTGDVRNRDTVYVCFAFLITSLVASIIVIPSTNYEIKRWYGACLMALYAVFLITSVSFQFAPLPGT